MVKGFGLFLLTTYNHHTIDKGLLFAFSKRWDTETNTFHLPVGEMTMTITLDDMESLLHIPITREFYNFEHTDKEAAISVLVDLLGV